MEKLSEKCGIFGIFGRGMEASRLTHSGLWALQHRGQESSGIASSDGETIRIHKGMGLVAQVYNEDALSSLQGFAAIGHNRYSTSRGSGVEHTQPVIAKDSVLALAHNGNLPSTRNLEEFLKSKDVYIEGLNDSELMYEAIRYYLGRGATLETAIKRCFPLFTGAFSLLIITKNKLAAVRDSRGIRPLSLGKLNGGFVFSSETCAFDTINARYIRDVKPGQMVVVGKRGLKSYQLARGEQKLDIFEFVYFARPDSMLLGKSVNEVRRNLGINLAREYKIKADVVIPVPDSAIPAALGYAQESGIPFDNGLIKNRYIHRTFIRPAQRLRDNDVELKLNPLPSVLRGRRVIVIDDSIVRGTTSKKLVSLIRRAGAKEVHLLISSPPVRFPDFYGIDIPNQNDLIAARMSVTAIEKFVGADSLNYLSYKGLIKSTGLPEKIFSTSCFTGVYPIDIAERKEEVSLPDHYARRSTSFPGSPSTPIMSPNHLKPFLFRRN
ncbi:MAG: amidophosphoribosyltransferase [bacterium]|nr:amidophosphoribosyltransferase [bacterium]